MIDICKKAAIGLLSMVLLVGCSSQLNEVDVEKSGEIVALDAISHDWGDISIDGGDVDEGFHFRNIGDDDLILRGVETSCMCTEAYLELPDGSISPTFGMTGNPEWEYIVEPGEELEVEVIFDPTAHGPDDVGPIGRSARLFTSAGTVEMGVSANVMYDEEYREKYEDSDFVFSESEFDFGIVKQSGEIVSHDFLFEYVGEEEIAVTGTPASCACASGEISDESFKKGDTGVLTVSFDPNLHEEPEGKFFKTVSILTEPPLEKQPEVKIWAEIDLDLGPDAYKLKQHKD